MDFNYNNYSNHSSYFGMSGPRSDDITTDSYQSPDVFLNLEEDKPQPKIEENDDFVKNEWDQEQKEEEQIIFNNTPFEQDQKLIQQQQIQLQQQQNMNLIPLGMNQKRSMKIKKEKAKQIANKKREQKKLFEQQQAQLLLQQQQQQEQQQQESQQQDQINISIQQQVPQTLLKQEQDSDSTNETIVEEKNQTLKSSNSSSSLEKPDKIKQQKIRNRISAQNSRDRKKAYIQDLENRCKQAVLQAQLLKDEMQKIQQENEAKDRENMELKKELMALKKKYGESTNYFDEPSLNQQRSSRVGGYLGLATLFSLAIIVLFSQNSSESLNLSSDNTTISRQLEQEQQQIQEEQSKFEQLDKKSAEFEELNIICRNFIDGQNKQQLNNVLPQIGIQVKEESDIKKEEINIKKEEDSVQNWQFEDNTKMVIEETNSIIKAKDQQQQQNLRSCKDTSTALVNSNSILNNRATSILCSQPYQFIPELQLKFDSSPQQYSQLEYLQLLIPYEKMTQYTNTLGGEDNGNIYVQRNDGNPNKLIEMQLKVISSRVLETPDVNMA